MDSLKGLHFLSVLSSFFSPWSAYVVAYWLPTISHVVSVGVATEFLWRLWICRADMCHKTCILCYVSYHNDTMRWMSTLDLNKNPSGNSEFKLHQTSDWSTNLDNTSISPTIDTICIAKIGKFMNFDSPIFTPTDDGGQQLHINASVFFEKGRRRECVFCNWRLVRILDFLFNFV